MAQNSSQLLRFFLMGAAAFPNVNSVKTDGINEYITYGNIKDNDGTVPFTLAAWIKPEDLSATRVMLGKAHTSTFNLGYHIWQNSTAIRFTVGDNITTLTWEVLGALTLNVWGFFAVTYDGAKTTSSAKIYKNGSLISGTGSGSMSGSSSHTDPFQAPWGSSSLGYFACKMKDVSYWNRVLTAAEVLEMYGLGQPTNLLSHSAAADLGFWTRHGDDPRDDATGTTGTIYDQTANGFDGTPINTEAGDKVADSP